jgi:two-component system, chemotaxis family, protein-glutamate methylesterase/glutaminase
MRKIRVLIVDDSTVIRRLLSDTLAVDPEIEIAATAPNGKIALAKLAHVCPDVVTLDIEMPEMDGLATVAELRKSYPLLPVIMFSTLTQRGAEATLEALARGANDYVMKPANVGSITAAMQSVRNDLIPKIKGLCKWYADAERSPSQMQPRKHARLTSPSTKNSSNAPCRIDIVAIGSSTGGPNALMTVLKELPASFPVPIVVVQHMPPVFTKHLATRLDQNCQMNVVEASAGDVLKAGTVYIAPGDNHMILCRKGASIVVETNQGPPENSCRPAVDTLFRSVSEVYGRNALAVVLTGMGQDGLRGAEAVCELGGKVIAQDEATSVVWGMPRAIAQAGLADSVLPLNSISKYVLTAMSCGRTQRSLVKA